MAERLVMIETGHIKWDCEACKHASMEPVPESIQEEQRTTQPFSMFLHQCPCGAQKWLCGRYPKTLRIHKELPYGD